MDSGCVAFHEIVSDDDDRITAITITIIIIITITIIKRSKNL
jgi:hypothetical protein